MNRDTMRRVVNLSLRGLLGGILLFAAIGKLLDNRSLPNGLLIGSFSRPGVSLSSRWLLPSWSFFWGFG